MARVAVLATARGVHFAVFGEVQGVLGAAGHLVDSVGAAAVVLLDARVLRLLGGRVLLLVLHTHPGAVAREIVVLFIHTIIGLLHGDLVERLESALEFTFKLLLFIILNLVELVSHVLALTCGESLELALSLRRKLLLSDAVRSLTAVSGVSQGLAFLNFLVNHEVCGTVSVLLIEWSHAEFLVS